MENQSDLSKPESWRSKKSGWEGRWHSTIIIPFVWFDWADLRCAQFLRANLENANLEGAKLKNANFCGANLKGANLDQIKYWKQIYCIRGANIKGIKNPPPGFVDWARLKCAIIDEIDPEEAGSETAMTNCLRWNNLDDWTSWQKKHIDTADLDDGKLESYYNDDGVCLRPADRFRDLKTESGEDYCK